LVYDEAMSLLKNGEIKDGLNKYNEANRISVIDPANLGYSIPNMQLECSKILIAKGKNNLAFKELKLLSATYCENKIIDATFTAMRGIPSFFEYLTLLKEIEDSIDRKTFDNLKVKLEENLWEDGQYFVKEILESDN